MRVAVAVLIMAAACGGSNPAAPDGGSVVPADAVADTMGMPDAATDAAIDAAPDATVAPDAAIDAAADAPIDAFDPGPYTVGGVVHGLTGGSVTIDNDNIEQLTISADGAFTFPSTWPSGTYYGVTVKALPSGPAESCSVTSGAGTIATADVTTVDVECVPSAPWASVAASSERTCGIHVDGTLFCWGNGVVGSNLAEGVPTEVAPGTHWRQVSVNTYPLYGIQADGTFWSWDYAGLHSIDATPNWSSIATSQNNVCGIRTDGTLWCTGHPEGWSSAPLAQIGTDTNWAFVAGSDENIVAIRTDGTLWAWGFDGEILGSYAEDSGFQPLVTDGAPWASAAVNESSACGIRTDGTLWCWGGYPFGVTTFLMPYVGTPMQVGTDTDWASVSIVGDHACGIRTSGALWCWGREEQPGSVIDIDPVQIGTADWTAVALGLWTHTCGVHQNGTMDCWGYNKSGELGIDPVDGNPTRVRTPTHFTQMVGTAVGNGCGIATDGSLWCIDAMSQILVPVAPGTTWQSVRGRTFAVSAIRSDGTLWQIDGTTLTQLADGAWLEGDLVPYESCGIQTDGSRWCWPTPDGGLQTGEVTPVRADTDAWIDVLDGWDSTSGCGIHTDGTLWCWSGGAPAQVGTETYRELSGAPGDSVYALRTDGEIECLGPYCEQSAPTATATVPALIVEPGPWAELASQQRETCARKADGTLWCWRFSEDPIFNSSEVPAQIGTATDWTSLRCPIAGVRADGGAWFWDAPFGNGNGDGIAYTPHRIAL
ncbi:MAG TPA: hypothetical protein VGM88_22510 [Kofleriaceae bacterium]|jgi:hypothetical protein